MNTELPGIAYLTLAGAKHGSTPAHALLPRASAAQAAGFSAIGASIRDYQGPDALKSDARWLHESGLRVSELEWGELASPDGEQYDILFQMAHAFGTKQINVGWCSTDPVPWASVIKTLRRLGERAHDEGHITIAVEPVVFGSMTDIPALAEAIATVGRHNVGLLLDNYQLARISWDTGMARIPADHIAAIQISGVDNIDPLPAWPDGIRDDVQSNRRLLHEGDWDVHRWLTSLHDLGVSAPVSIEIASAPLRAMPLIHAAEAVALSWNVMQFGGIPRTEVA